ncbi:uncharacterized protein LOC115672878 isoform X1 [Syzygium oleosum]|uniref:uncharacterized protein LOC115672878 isoform X1 n=1 Tax=Syzygium oleosum TaxID=219896 RepID=UPI0024BAC37A|nr:uncharacterized protein LOC115672878 isoform X1 [Syzygium oleosum]
MEHPVSPATPTSLDRHSEALSQRMRNDFCFACKKQGHWMKDCPVKSPGGSQPSPAAAAVAATVAPPCLDRQNGAPSQGTRGGACFACKKQGHWMKDCPGKSPAKSQPPAADVPVLECRCGAGACAVRTSHSLQNPDRKYYKCPDRAPNDVGGCGFFAWCDKYSAPMCPCGAGRCRINFFEDPPPKGREYFSCRIRKGHGACEFFQWADSPTENVGSRDVATFVVAPPEVMEIESAMADAGEDYEVDPLSMMDSGEIEEVICRFSAPERHLRVLESESLIPEADLDTQELAMEDVDLGESTTEQMQLVSRVTSPSPIRLRQQEYLRRISAAADMLAGSRGTLDRLPGCLVIRWCGRLSFPPRPSLADPSPTPSFCDCVSYGLGILPSLAVDHMDISSVGQSHLESGMDYRNLQFSTGNSFLAEHVSETSSEVSRFLSHPELASNHWSRGKMSVLNQMAKLVQKDIIDLLEKNSLDHAHLEQEARDRLDCLDFLPVDSSQFKEQVKEFLLCASRLAEVERPTNETAMPNVLERCSRAKKRFRDVSEKHSVTSDAYAACDGRIKHLREDYQRAKETLLRIEAELHGCQVEHAELQGRFAEITREMEEAKSGMEEASREASLAVQRRESERCTARAALEKARLQLHSNLRKRACVVTNQP